MPTLMKNGLGMEAVQRIGHAIRSIDSNFASDHFVSSAMHRIGSLELRQRVDCLIELLNQHLPKNFESSANLLEQIPDHWDSGDQNDPLRGFAAWPIIDYVGRHGLDHPVISLELLKRLTPLFSAEFAIRPFLLQHAELTLATMQQWCNDPSDHVRRLVSEGSRPRLPWGQQLKPFIADPTPIFHLLEPLKDDPSEYVRRSVANNLNDIAKDHPQLIIDHCLQWHEEANDNRKWIIRHATRTLVKQGYPGVFTLLGYTDNPQISLTGFELDANSIEIGESLGFCFDLNSDAEIEQQFVVDYAVHYAKANGKTNHKVFKLKNLALAPGETATLTKKHSFRPVTTRKYYAGRHAIEILINGESIARQEFDLL